MSLTERQSNFLREFYSLPKTKVVIQAHNAIILANYAKTPYSFELSKIRKYCPAIEHQIRKSWESGNNIQSSVFSECAYAQSLANMLGLNLFINCYEENYYPNKNVSDLLNEYSLTPRYIYKNSDNSRLLIQAGGCNGVDSALISIIDNEIYTIEFKNPTNAKLGEADLPKYDESGVLKITQKFIDTYPYFEQMLDEQKGLNFFENIGNNINDFSDESVRTVARYTYSGIDKQADVVCTEDSEGYLISIPANEVEIWGDVEGEIRPAGRNHYDVWTPQKLKQILKLKGAVFNGEIVSIDKSELTPRKGRGSNDEITGYKINSLFFIYLSRITEYNNKISFNINDVQQLNPTIAGKIFFRNLHYDEIKNHYLELL